MRDYTNQFIDRINDIYPANYVLPTNSGTSALISALYACNLTINDEVIIPVNSCAAVINAVICVKAIPIFCDVDDQMQICFDSIKKVLNKSTKVIVIVHRFGSSCDLHKLKSILDEIKYEGILIEDGAQAFGQKKTALLKPTGVSDIYITSFGYGKIIDIDGGGLLLTNNKDIYTKAFRFSNLGADKIPFFLSYGLNFHLSKYLIPSILSAIEILDKNIMERRQKANYIYNKLKQFGFTDIQDYSNCVFHRLVLKKPKEKCLSDIINMINSNDIIVRNAYPFLLIDYNHIVRQFPSQAKKEYPNALCQKKTLLSLYVDHRYDEALINVIGEKLNIP